MTLRQLSQHGFLTTDKISIWPYLLLSTRSNYSVIHTHKHVHTYLTIPKSVTDKWCKEYWLHIATVYIFVSKSADILLRRTKEEQKKNKNGWWTQDKSKNVHTGTKYISHDCSLIMNETCFTVKLVHTMWCTVSIIIKTWLLKHDRTYLKMYRNVPTYSLSFAQKHVKVGGWSKQEAGGGGLNLNLNYQETKFFSSNVETGFTTSTAPTS